MLEILVGTIAAFLAGGVYYAVFATGGGAILHENTPVRLAVLHGGDWLIKLLLVGAIVSMTVTSSAGDASLSVSDPGHLVNGAFSLPQPLQVAFSKSAWTGPVSNEAVTVNFKQSIAANDALRTGAYSKTLTFTLSTTQP